MMMKYASEYDWLYSQMNLFYVNLVRLLAACANASLCMNLCKEPM